jgi:DNA-binding response OmpR family regulator
VTDAGDGPTALAAFDERGADLVILDLMLPGMPGETVLEALRDAGDVPVLITSAKRSDAQRIAGLRAGADDYLAKPFNPHELTARVAAILRRTRAIDASGPPPILSFGGGRLVLDPASRRFTVASGDGGRLTPGETALLVALASRPGTVLGRQQLLDVVARRPDEVYERVVDVHVANLRRKLSDDPGEPWLIETVPAAGYRLVATLDVQP